MEEINEFFNLESIKKNHGDQIIDARFQQREYDSFTPAKFNSQEFMINEYIEYLENPGNTKAFKIQDDKILFAVNVNTIDWMQEMIHLQQYLPKCLIYQGQNDGLSYLWQQIDGVNRPQIYIKTGGVWTGGHQENLGLNAININHGPSDCVWITIDQEYVENLRQNVLEQFGTDIIKNEGLWFKEPDYFLINSIPFRYSYQKKGDIVILGAGCLHWVKSLGQTLNTAWNLLVQDEFTFQIMSQRYQLNQEIDYRTVIPYKNLLFDIYIHEHYLTKSILQHIYKQLQLYYEEENKQISLLDEPPSLYQKDCAQVLLCSRCRHEIFLFFLFKKNNICVQIV